MNRIVPQVLFYHKSLLFIEVQPFQYRQGICFASKIKGEFLGNQSFGLYQILRIIEFFKSTENHIIRQIMHIFLLNDRIISQWIHPSRIHTKSFFHTGDDQWIIKSNDLTLLSESKVLIWIHQAKDTILAGSYPTNRETPTAVGTCHTVERKFSKGGVIQICMQSDQYTFNRLQVRGVKHRSRYFHCIDLRTGRKSKCKITQRIAFVIIDDGIREIYSIGSIRL